MQDRDRVHAESLGVWGQVMAGLRDNEPRITGTHGGPLLTHTCTPAGIPTIPRVPQWNSTQPEEDRSITDGGKQWTTNKWLKEGQEKTATQRAAQREGVAAGSKKRFQNNSSRSPRLFSPLRPLWQFVRYSTLPKMAAPLGYSCWKLLWEPCRHRLTLHFLCTRLNLNDTRRKRRVSGYRLQVASAQERCFHWQIPETTTALTWHVPGGPNKLRDNLHTMQMHPYENMAHVIPRTWFTAGQQEHVTTF